MSQFFKSFMKKVPEVVDNPMVPTSEQSASVKSPVELYLELTTICMKQAELMTSYTNRTPSLRFNHEQCKHLARKLKIAVQSAQLFFAHIKTWYTTCAPPEHMAEILEIFKLLFALSKEVESFIQRCCKEQWIQSAIMLTNVWRHIWSITFRLEFCTIVFNSRKISEASVTSEALALVSQSEAKTVKEMADLDKRKMSMELHDLIHSISSRAKTYRNPKETMELAMFLLKRLNSTRLNTGSKSLEPFQSLGHPEIMITSLKRLEKLGRGAFGTVYKATWLGAEVALKSFHGPANPEFLHEVSILAGLHHPNILSLFWYVTDEHKCQIIMELMDKDLNTLMEDRLDSGIRNHPPFTISETLDIILQVAEGVLFLHDMHIVHRDLKSYNILVKIVKTTGPADTEHIHIKISDYGLSTIMERSVTCSNQTPNTGTSRWMAPEVINIRNYDGQVEVPKSEVKYPFKSDVYSFAMVCYEVLTGRVPFSTVGAELEVKKMVLEGDRPPLPKHCPSELGTLIKACWSAEASTRPSFHQICAELRQMRYSHLMTTTWAACPKVHCCSFSMDEINTMTNGFNELLDSISNREIYKGTMIDTGKVVAVDRVSSYRYFKRNLEVLPRLYDDNVVRCVGFCDEEDETILLYDDMPTSTLSDWHQGDMRDVNHEWPARKRILFGVANGIHYLHSVPRLIHRAIQPDDILLNDKLEPKLAGFALSLFQAEAVTSSYDFVIGLEKLQGRWRAPEYECGKISEKVDVYSYGLLLFEVVSGRRVSWRYRGFRRGVPFYNRHLDQGWELHSEKRSEQLIDCTLHLTPHEHMEAARMMKIAFLCMHKEPETRPDMSVVLEMMHGKRDAEIESLVLRQYELLH